MSFRMPFKNVQVTHKKSEKIQIPSWIHICNIPEKGGDESKPLKKTSVWSYVTRTGSVVRHGEEVGSLSVTGGPALFLLIPGAL